MTGAQGALAGRTILIVEELYLVGQDMRRILEEAGARTIGPVADVRQALAITVQQHLDGALLDVRLRDDTSTAVAETLVRQGVPFIVVTGFPSDAVPGALRKGIYLAKPVTRGPLLQMASTLFTCPANA